MPWHIAADHPSCGPKERFAVVADADGTVEGCHPTRAQAEEQMAAMYAAEAAALVVDFSDITAAVFGQAQEVEQVATPKLVAGGKPSKGTPADKRLKRNRPKAPAMPAYAATEPDPATLVPWEGVLVVEGTPTGDGRRFAAGSLSWPDPATVPFPLQWQKESSHGGTQDVTVNVGAVTEIFRDGPRIMGRGVVDTATPDGAEIGRRLEALRDEPGRGLGVSIVADDPDHAEIELVYADGCDPAGPDLSAVLAGQVEDRCLAAEETIFHSGRLRALTVVDVPAFVEAQIRPAGAPVAVTAAAVSAHSTATVDGTWDEGAAAKALPSPLSVDTARAAYAWIDQAQVSDGNLPKDAAKFLHHEVSDGRVGAANTTAASAGIAALHGARGGTTIPDADRRGVYNHLARHLRDAGREPPPFNIQDSIEALAAAAWAIQITDRPPAEWFTEPAELPEIGAITVDDDGRLFGLLAPAGVAHGGYPQRLTVPMGRVDYSRWMCRPTICADGSRIATGVITMECGHPDLSLGAAGAADHYDNSCAIVATAAIGENAAGVWIAGALLPDVAPARVARMLACQLSGDWRPHREKPGWREFVAALLVPVPGFPFAGARRSVRFAQATGLVAAAVPMAYHPAEAEAPVSPAPARDSLVPAVDVRQLARMVRGEVDV